MPDLQKVQVEDFVESLLLDLDVGGSHYAPDLRDSITDHREWLQQRLIEFLVRVGT